MPTIEIPAEIRTDNSTGEIVGGPTAISERDTSTYARIPDEGSALLVGFPTLALESGQAITAVDFVLLSRAVELYHIADYPDPSAFINTDVGVDYNIPSAFGAEFIETTLPVHEGDWQYITRVTTAPSWLAGYGYYPGVFVGPSDGGRAFGWADLYVAFLALRVTYGGAGRAPICRGYPRHGAGGNSSPRAYPPSKARQGSPRATGYY
jgi:hypothetical protein